MTRSIPRFLACSLLLACSSSSDGGLPAPFDPSQPYAPTVTGDALSTAITNPLFPAPAGATWVYEMMTPDGLEHTEIGTRAGEKAIAAGASARVVRDTVYLDGAMIEDTDDWYGQDADGNVWYLGEKTAEYEGGVVTTTAGTWEWGVMQALPGVVMLAAPRVGDIYRQEYLEAEAQDYAEVLAVDETVTVPAGTFEHCVKTSDRSVLDTTAIETKYYCPGVGMTLTEEAGMRDELIEYAGL